MFLSAQAFTCFLESSIARGPSSKAGQVWLVKVRLKVEKYKQTDVNMAHAIFSQETSLLIATHYRLYT